MDLYTGGQGANKRVIKLRTTWAYKWGLLIYRALRYCPVYVAL